MDERINPGIYRHYKGGIYEVMSVAKHSESLEDLVVYKSVTDTEKWWVRPASMWNETVNHDGISETRFTYIASSVDDMDNKQLFKTIEDIVFLCESYDIYSEENSSGFVNKETGEVVILLPNVMRAVEGDIEEAELTAQEKALLTKAYAVEESNDFISIPHDGLIEEYDIMEDFASELPSNYRDRLENCFDGGKGAFRRFKDAVARMNLSKQWYYYRDIRYRREAREWCDVHEVKWWFSFVQPLND